MYQPRVYRTDGGDTLVVASGGKIVVEAGGQLAQQEAIADLNMTVESPPTQQQVQAIADKVDAILGALRAAGIVAPSA